MTTFYNIQLPLFTLTKVCHRCNPPTEKPLEEFNSNPYSKDGRKSICKVCDYATTKARREANPEHYKAQQQASYLKNIERVRAYNAAHLSQRREQTRKRYNNDAEYRARYRQKQSRWISSHRDQANEWARKWREANPRKGTEYTMRYNARKKGAAIEDVVDYAAIILRDGFWCYICEAGIDPTTKGRGSLAFDHVVPLTRNGVHAESNIKPAHKCCNSRKHNKLLAEMTPFQRRGV